MADGSETSASGAPKVPPPASTGKAGFGEVITNAVNALRPYGPTPIVTVVIGGLGLAALAVGAPQLATVVVVGLSYGAYFIGQERKAVWRRRELEAEYDAIERGRVQSARAKLEERIKLPGKQVGDSVGTDQGDGR